MGRSYTFMVLQREICTKNFQHWITTTGRFTTASIIPLQINLVYQLWIYLPLPSTIDPAGIKEPAIPQIFSQLPYLLPLKIILVILPPLLIRHISYLLMILILSMLWRNMCISLVGFTYYTVVGKMIKKDATKRQSYISPHALMI